MCAWRDFIFKWVWSQFVNLRMIQYTTLDCAWCDTDIIQHSSCLYFWICLVARYLMDSMSVKYNLFSRSVATGTVSSALIKKEHHNVYDTRMWLRGFIAHDNIDCMRPRSSQQDRFDSTRPRSSRQNRCRKHAEVAFGSMLKWLDSTLKWASIARRNTINCTLKWDPMTS